MSALSAAGGGASASGGTAPKLTTKSKFNKLDINNLYRHSRGESSEASLVKSQLNRKHGMQILGKVPSARRPPANLPSLKTESGLDPNTNVSSTSSPSSTPAPTPVASSTTTSSGASPVTASVTAAPPSTPSATSIPSSASPASQQCPPQSNTQSHQHAGPFQGGWAALPHHRSAQFQHEFPSLDGAAQSHTPGPSLRPQTEGSWMSGGSRGGAADGPAPGGDLRSAPNHLHRALIPNFMYKGSGGSGGNNAFPPVFGSQAPTPGPTGRHPPPNRGPPRTRELSTMDKLVQTPIIKEEELNSMDDISQDAGWAMNEDIDYSQKLAFSDDESPPKESTTPSNRETRGSSKDNAEIKAQSPAPARQDAQDKRQNVIKGLDEDELSAMRRQHSSELAAVAERAKQRKQQEERRYEEEKRARQQESQSQKSEIAPANQDSEKSAPVSNEKDKIDSEPPRDQRSSNQGGKLNKSSSRDNVRNGPDSSDFRQLTQIDGRNFKERDRKDDRDRGNYRDKDYRERESRDRDSERENRGRDNRDNRDYPRSERDRDREMRAERDGPFKLFYGNMPPRFLKQGRGQQQQGQDNRQFSDNEFNNRSSSERQDPKEKRNDHDKNVPFAQQYDTRFAFPNVKSIQSQSNKRNDNDGGKNIRRRMDSDIGNKDGDKQDDRRRERHTPDEPRHPRHSTRKLSGSSDGRGRDYSDNEYQRWEKDHDRRSGSSFDDKKNHDYNDHGPQRDDWRSSDKDYDKGRSNYREIDRQSSRESQKEFSDGSRKSDFERKSIGEKSSSQEFDSRKSENYDRKSSEKYERPDRPESRDSRELANVPEKSSWNDASQEGNLGYPKSNKNDSIKSDYSSSRDNRDYKKGSKSDSDESRRGGIQIKKSPSNLQKSDLATIKDGKVQKNESEPATVPPKISDNSAPVIQKTEPPKAWAEVSNPLSSSGNKSLDEKDSEKSDLGKERLERKLSSSSSEKKSSIGSRNRLDSDGSRRGSVYYRGNWSGRGGDPRRRKFSRQGHSRSNRGDVYSESEISGDENAHADENKLKNRSPKFKKAEKDERNKNMGTGNVSNNGPFQNQSDDNRGFPTSDTVNPRKRNDVRGEGREAFAPRGEPSRRGRGSFRGRSGYGSHGSKHPFSQGTPIGETGDNDLSKGELISADEKGKTKPYSAGAIGRERRGASPRQQDKKQPRNKTGGPTSDEGEAWETTSEQSEGGTRQVRRQKANRQGGKIEDRKPSQGNRNSGPPQNRQNSAGNINRSKKDDPNALCNSMSDMAIGPKSGKDVKKDDSHSVDEGYQDNRVKKNLKGEPQKVEPIAPINKPQKPHHKDGQRNNSSSRNLSDKPGQRTSGPLGALIKQNGPQSDRPMGPPLKTSNYDKMRQTTLAPRFMRQRENSWMKQNRQGGGGYNANQVSDSNMGQSAWEKPINPTIRDNDPSIIIGNVTIPNPDSNELGTIENHSGHSSQRSTPNTSSNIDQKAPGTSIEKSSILDGTTTPVKTIIFENTNYKSGPEGHKQKFAPVGNQQNVNSASNKNQQCAPSKSLDLDTQILNFTSESLSDLIPGETNQSAVKQDPAIQLPMSFKNPEDSVDMKLDFFDSELSQLTEDKSSKSLNISRMHGIGSSQNSISTATDQELNMKIASVKKVWDTTVMEHPTSEESTHTQHNLSNPHLSVSSPHSLSTQHTIGSHHMTTQHNLTQHAISQHSLGVSQHAVSSSAAQFTTGFDDHQVSVNDVQSQGFSPSSTGVTNQTMNVCKVKPQTQQTLHSNQAMTGLQNMQATLIGQNISQTTAALQSMQGVGGVMGLSPPPMQHTYNHINYPGNQYGGIPAIPSPPNVMFNQSQPLLNSSQQMPSQGNLYNAFQIEQSRNQYGGFPSGPYGASSAPYANYQPDMFQGIQNQYRMQDLFQPNNAFGQSGQLGTNPNTMLISSTTSSLMSASVKPSSQQIGPIGTKGGSYQTQQYIGYGAPHEAQAPPYPTSIPPPSLVRAAPQAAPPPPLQAPNTYYSQNTVAGGQTGFYQQTGNVSANYGMQFNQPNQNHSSAGMQGFGSQVLSSQYQMAAAMQQYGRAAHQGQYVGSGNTGAPGGKQDHQVQHQSAGQQLKSPLQDHLNNGMFGNSNQGGSFGVPGGSASPKGNPVSNSNNGKGLSGPASGFNSGNSQKQPNSGSQHSPPQHQKYQQPYPHMQQVMQANGRQASLNMAMNRGNLQQQRFPSPIQRPHAAPPSHQQQSSNYNRGGNNRHTSGGNQPHNRHALGGGYSNYQQNMNRNTPQPVAPSVSEPQKPTSIAEEIATSTAPVTTATPTSDSATTVTAVAPVTTPPVAPDVNSSVEKKATDN